jgi:hypothetical protein
MTANFDARRLSEWIEDIATTQDDEVDCEAMAEMFMTVIEASARGEDFRAALPHIALHLDHCPDCREFYETLVEIAKQMD